MKVDRKQAIAVCTGMILAGVAAAGLIGWQHEREKVSDLQAQISELKKEEMRSAVDRSVSAQMEAIAKEQSKISDEKREEALQQTRVANEMRLRSEAERQNALEAERSAMASEKKALEASALAEDQRRLAEDQRQVAEQQRQMAEHQRIQAEFSKRKADTLSYIALGRSLSSIATIQSQAGNSDIANLLGYASYVYTSRYQGDVYYPAVFRSLLQLSRSVISWTEHNGVVMNAENIPGKDNTVVSVSNYGEIILSKRQGSQLHSTPLFNDSHYDFRDVIIDRTTGSIWAVSRTGHLVIIDSNLKTVATLVLDKVEHPMRLHDLDDHTMLVIGERAIATVDLKRRTVRSMRMLPFRVTCGARKDLMPLLFDDQGRMHLVRSVDNFDTQEVPVDGKVTAYCSSKNTGFEAFGMSDGTIWISDRKGRKQQLVGHRSRISKMKFNGRQLFSASYDGTVELWLADKEKMEPITLTESGNWIMHFCFDSQKHTLWAGDAKGKLTAINISIPVMVETIRKRLKRNLTTEEWNYFIGQDVPYEPFVGHQAKLTMP